jgi:hypothetical protein
MGYYFNGRIPDLQSGDKGSTLLWSTIYRVVSQRCYRISDRLRQAGYLGAAGAILIADVERTDTGKISAAALGLTSRISSEPLYLCRGGAGYDRGCLSWVCWKQTPEKDDFTSFYLNENQ